MDGNTSIQIGFLLAFVGSAIGVFGYVSKRDAKKYSEGKEDGALQQLLKSMNATLEKIEKANDQFQREHKEEHKDLNKRLQDVENKYSRMAASKKVDSIDV